MIYELSQDGYRLGSFPTEAQARHHAAYMPKGNYTLREWTHDDEFLVFEVNVNTEYDINNSYDYE